MIRQPPTEVRTPIVIEHRSPTPKLGWNSGSTPPSTSARVNTPMNFCPSLLPWLNAMNTAEKTCSLPKTVRTRPGVQLAQIDRIDQIKKKPAKKPRKVEKRSPISTFCQPSQRRTEGPAAASPAPERPATRAWLELVGKP